MPIGRQGSSSLRTGSVIRPLANVSMTGYAQFTTSPVGPVDEILTIPIISVSPIITGSLPVGSVLSTTTGTWLHFPASYYYVWYRGTELMETEHTNQYTSVEADVGIAITCRVTATNAAGDSISAPSNGITVTSA